MVNRRTFLYQSTLLVGASLVYPYTSIASSFIPTPPQSLGPFYPIRIPSDTDYDLTRIGNSLAKVEGQLIDIMGRVVNTQGNPIKNAAVEIWQANQYGRYNHPRDTSTAPLDNRFLGYGKVITQRDGMYRFLTIKPGTYKVARDWTRPPHIHFKVQAPGFKTLVTQMYFNGNRLNDGDGILQSARNPEQLIVDFTQAHNTDVLSGQFDIVLETV